MNIKLLEKELLLHQYPLVPQWFPRRRKTTSDGSGLKPTSFTGGWCTVCVRRNAGPTAVRFWSRARRKIAKIHHLIMRYHDISWCSLWKLPKLEGIPHFQTPDLGPWPKNDEVATWRPGPPNLHYPYETPKTETSVVSPTTAMFLFLQIFLSVLRSQALETPHLGFGSKSCWSWPGSPPKPPTPSPEPSPEPCWTWPGSANFSGTFPRP